MAATSRIKSPKKQLNEAAVGSDDYLASLTRRLEVLEKKLLGKRQIKEDQPPLYPTVEKMHQKLADCLGSPNKAKVHALWDKVDSLECMLHPDFLHNTTSVGSSQDEAKEDLLISYARQLEAAITSTQVEELQQLKDYINTTEFQGLEGHEKHFARVVRRNGEQESQVEEIASQVQALLKAYHTIVLQLSAQCVTQAEDLDRQQVAS